MDNNANKGGLVTGYKILLIVFAANVVGTGIGFYGFGVFFKPLAQYFDVGRKWIGLANGLSLVVAALYAPRVGKAVDRWGLKPLLVGGAVTVAVALVGMSLMKEYWQFLILYGFIFALGNIHLGDIVTGSTIAKEFPLSTGRALGIATVGVSFGGLIIPPVAQAILMSKGWRAGFIFMSAVALLLVLVPAMTLLRGWNSRRGDTNAAPQGSNHEIAPQWADGNAPAFTRGQAFRSLVFWKMIVMFSLSYLPLGTMLVQQVPFLTDMGIPVERAAWILSLTATAGMIGKFSWGLVFDKVESRHAVIACILLQLFAIIWLLNARNVWDALIFSVTYGFGMGGLVPLHTAFRARQFGARNIGAIMGISSPFIMLAQAFGQPFSGWIFDRTRSYHIAFTVFIVCYLIAIAIALTIKDPDKVERISDLA